MNAQHPLSNGETGNDLLKHNKRTDGHPYMGFSSVRLDK